MSFAENLRAIRKERGFSQEDLAEMLNVSRQAVSKWEQDEGGYPETEKLIQIAQKLDISLDTLLLDKELIDKASIEAKGDVLIFPVDNKITVQSVDGKTTSAFYKFKINKVSNIFGIRKKGKPEYVLCGTDSSNFLGDNLTLLGWYLDYDTAQKELIEIHKAIQNGEVIYELKYTTDVKPGWFNVI